MIGQRTRFFRVPLADPVVVTMADPDLARAAALMLNVAAEPFWCVCVEHA
jgi:hypothetical protein